MVNYITYSSISDIHRAFLPLNLNLNLKRQQTDIIHL